jgi:hypothetical protein
LNVYPYSELPRSRGSRAGGPARKAAGLSLCLVAIAGLAAACGSSASSAKPTVGPSASIGGPSASVDATPYAWAGDSGGFGSASTALSDAGYTARYEEGLDHLGEAFAVIEQGLPKAIDLNEAQTGEPDSLFGDVQVYWWPDGRHDTALPPGGHGERIYRIVVDLGPYVRGEDAVAHVWFVSRAQADALDPQDLMATPDPYPNEYFVFQIDKETAEALINVFWVKG